MCRRPHPFFWAVVAVVGLAVAAAALAGDGSPGFALESNLVYRLQVGLFVGVVSYLLVLALWHGWHGKALARIGAGPASVETAPEPVDETLDKAADDLEAFQDKTDRRIGQLEEAVAELDERVGPPDREPRNDGEANGVR